jgi:hypothetical protein
MICLQCVCVFFNIYMHNTELETFPYFLGSLVVFCLIACVCGLKRIFLYHKMLLVQYLIDIGECCKSRGSF